MLLPRQRDRPLPGRPLTAVDPLAAGTYGSDGPREPNHAPPGLSIDAT